MTIRKEWSDALKTHGVDVDAAMATLDLASRQPGIPTDEEIGLAEIALQHSADMFSAGKLSQSIQYGREARALTDSLRKELALIPELIRDRARQDGTRNLRGSRMPLLDSWLAQRLKAGNVSNNKLWKALPDHDDDEAGTFVFRDGDNCVIERENTRDASNTRTTSRKGFDNRVTAVRKSLPVSN